MPVSSGLRSRPQVGLVRPLSARSVGFGNVVKIVPKTLLFPIALIACVTAFSAVLWTHDIHSEDAVAGMEAPTMTGTISKTN
jgi:hypothetical protein